MLFIHQELYHHRLYETINNTYLILLCILFLPRFPHPSILAHTKHTHTQTVHLIQPSHSFLLHPQPSTGYTAFLTHPFTQNNKQFCLDFHTTQSLLFIPQSQDNHAISPDPNHGVPGVSPATCLNFMRVLCFLRYQVFRGRIYFHFNPSRYILKEKHFGLAPPTTSLVLRLHSTPFQPSTPSYPNMRPEYTD